MTLKEIEDQFSRDCLSRDEEAVRNIYREIAAGVGGHGDFLRSFAQAVIRADPENFQLLKPAAVKLAVKYGLYHQAIA